MLHNRIITSLLCILLLSSIALAFQPFDLTSRRQLISGTGLDQPYQLEAGLIIENSEKISIDDSLLVKEQDYRIDYVRGILRLKGVLAVSDTAIVYYQVFPFDLPVSYYNPILTIRDDEVAEIDTIKPPQQPSEAQVFDTGTLRKSGTLVRGITIGSDQDLSVESGLNLQVEGRLGRNIDILALLNDQNTPIQPEGNTATIEEIDKVLIQVKTPKFDATFGDYELVYSGNRFGGYYRKLQGARLDARLGDVDATISGAVSRGQYHSNFFFGEEGNQGPYRLSDKQGRTGILVLAGTEKVWLDGVRLQRGENNDYTIEYGLGEIIFTPRRLITSDSRITVDFQFSNEVYSRDIYTGFTEARFLNNRLGIRTTAVAESDARNNPLAYVLTDSAKSALQAAGDDPTAAEILQVLQVEVGEGEYLADTTSWGGATYAIYTYVGFDSIGDYNVVFSYVGYNQGDYARVAGSEGFYYEWVGPNQGEYAPVQRLPLPQHHRLADVEIWGEPTKTSSIRFEGAASDLDLNTWSEEGDGDNVGVAWSTEGHWQSSEEKSSGDFSRLMLDANVRDVDAKFRQIDRTQQIEYDRYWDLDSGASEEESVAEAKLTLRPISFWTSSGSYGFIDKASDGFQSERWSGESRFTGRNLPQVTANADWIRSSSEPLGRTGFWTRGKSSTSYRIWRLTPSLSYEREHKRNSYADSTAGFQFSDYIAGMIYEAGYIKLESSQGFRSEDRYKQEELSDFSASQTSHYKAGLSSWHDLSGDLLYTHRAKKFDEADSAEVKTDLMEINFGWTPFGRAVDLAANYRINNTQVSSLVQTPLYVGAGQGTHVKVGDIYFEDPDGEYILVAQSTGDFTPVVELEGSMSLDLDPYRLAKGVKEKLPIPWKHLSSQTLINFSEKTKERDVWALYRLDFSKFQGDSTLLGNLLVREDLYLFRHSRDLSFRLRGEINQSISNLYLSGGQETKRQLISFRVRRSFSEEWSLQGDIGRESDMRNYRLSGVSSRDINSWVTSLEPVFRPSRVWEFGVRAGLLLDNDGVEDIQATRYGLEPRIVRSFMQKGRGELRGSWYHVTTNAESLPYEMAEGDPPGDNFRWDLRLDYRISRYLTATVSYSGSKDADRDAIHIGRAEVRAFF
ncbi:hypothetical protein KJ564_05145 [bacterium]|nr:hypothetical protein [bacterium]